MADPLLERMFIRCREAQGAYAELLTDISNGVVRIERGLVDGPTVDITPFWREYLKREIAALRDVVSEYEARGA
jgi:hypothetical protein